MKKNSPFFKTDKQSPSRMNWKKTRLNFGMYMGYTIQKIWEMDAQYLRWLLQNTDTLNLRKFEEDRIYEKALVEDEAQTKRAERRARKFFGGAREISGELHDLFPFDTAFSRYDSEELGFMDEEPH